MKKLIVFILTSVSVYCFSQVAIGKSEITKLADNITPNPSISLEFGDGNKGIVLPWVTSEGSVTGAVNGTIIYDITDKKVKYLKSGSWFDLSIDANGAVDTSLQDPLTEYSNAKVAIGTNGATDSTPGILVLTDTDKAMVLPKMASPHLNIKNPTPGTMAYDTNKKQLAIYNGTNWSFWKP